MKRGPTKRTNDPKKRVTQDLRRFKARLNAMVNKTQIVWAGQPFGKNSTYQFKLDDDLVEFIAGVIQQTYESIAKDATTETATNIRDMIADKPTERRPI